MTSLIHRRDLKRGVLVECPRNSSVGPHNARITYVTAVGTDRTVVTLDCGHDVNMSDGHGLYAAPE